MQGSVPVTVTAAIKSYKHAVMAYLNWSVWRTIVPVAEEAISDQKMRSTDLGVTVSLLAVDYFAWSKQTEKAKTMLRATEGLVELNTNRPSHISSLLKAYQACVNSADYLTAYGHFYQSWETSPDQDDLFPLKRAHVMALKCGRSDLIYDAVSKLYAMHNYTFPIPYMAGMVSFGLEQIGDYSRAERVAREGYCCDSVTDDDIWLDHALAHSLYFQGKDRQKDAIDFFEEHHQSWESRRDMLHPFIYTHCFWHWALVLVETGKLDDALKIFDTNLWWSGREVSEGMFTAENLMDEQVLVNALGLLWKLQSRLADQASPIDLESRWKSVASIARLAPSWLAHVDSLLDILLIRGLIEAGLFEDAATLVRSIKAEKSKSISNVAEAVYECCSTPSSSSRNRLLSLKDDWNVIGGSEEQRLCLLELANNKPCVSGLLQ